MKQKKINKLGHNLRKILISFKIFSIFFILLYYFNYDSFASNNTKESPAIAQGWDLVFNNPQKALDICLTALIESDKKNDSLSSAELNRLIGTAYYCLSDYQKSLEYYTFSLTYFYQNNLTLKIADLYNDIALVYNKLNRYEESRYYLYKTLNIFSKHNKKREESLVLTNIGLTYFYDFDYVNAVSYYLKAIIISDKLNDKESLAILLNNLAVIYKTLKNYDQALEYYEKAYQIIKSNNDLPSLAVILNNIGNIYFHQNKFDEALDNYSKSLELKKKINNRIGIAVSFNNFGEVYEGQEDFTNALDYYNKALSMMDEIHYFSGLIYTTDCIGRVYFKQKDYRNAELFFLRSVELGKINNIPTKTSHYYLSEIYKFNDEYEKSLFHLQKFASIRDSVIGSEKVQQINELLANYETLKKDTEISNLTESNRIKEMQIRERTIFIVALTLLILSLIIFAYIIYRYSRNLLKARDELNEINRIQKETNIKLEKALDDLKKENGIRKETEMELLKAQEKLAESLEKAKELNELKTRFISMVSHEYRNPLTVIMNVADFLPNLLKEKGPENHERYLQMIKKQVDVMVKLLNDVLVIGKKGSIQQELNILTMPITELCKDVVTNIKHIDENKHKLILNAAPGTEMITSDLQHLTHALTNILTNSAKYSPSGSDIYIDIFPKDDFYKITITDKGIGIPEADKAIIFEPFHRGSNIGSILGNGLGLSIVKMYMELLGGQIDFESQENNGSTFTLTIPKVLKQ